ncbi:uncharacterized protein LOC143293041 [Babylonia areolata]|uniref:uncharacterized protein LOC143293041 n=1 Tax=Babylonia areolata TaxID=304850 RepID=UPI003FD0E509
MPSLGSGGAGVRDTIRFHLNGKEHTVSLSGSYSPTTSLNDYIRVEAGLTGTKVMCREAGCGCCAVAVTMEDPLSQKAMTRSINSCLCPLASVDGWQVTTVEGLGGEKDGYHPIQKRIAAFNGTQCGYCTPGMVMTMYGLLHENSKPKEQEVEDQFDGNICRCTGYRSILDSMKSFAADTNIKGAALIDIEDLNKKLCPRTGEACKGNHSPASGSDSGSLHVQIGGSQWFRPTSLKELGGVMRDCKGSSVRLLFGNTSAGIFKDEGPFDVYIDVREVKDLYKIEAKEKCVRFGANTSLTSLIQSLKDLQARQPGFRYFGALVRHLKLVGNSLMRNAASVAGNLMIKHAHPDFPSDVFTMTEAAGARVEIFDSKEKKCTWYTLEEFVRKVDMKSKVLVTLELPALDVQDRFRSYKITPRSQNAHAYVNAAFRFKVLQDSKIVDKPSIVIGGINEKITHAVNTEAFLQGKEIKESIVKEALSILQRELNPTTDPVLAPADYRRDLAVNLLYKTLLGIARPTDPKLTSGGQNIERPLSSGEQTWQNHIDEWPLKEPLPKKTAQIQAAGEAEFVNDMPRYRQEMCGALVLTTVANATIDTIDPAPALAMPGVERFISASDIPEGGINNAYANYQTFPLPLEEVFCSGKVEYAGQAVGMILAETQVQADQAAKKVVVTYKDVQKPILTFEEAIEAQNFHPCYFSTKSIGEPEEALAQSAKQIEGEVRIGQQYHFYMETICSLCVPTEEGMEVFLTTQITDMAQVAIAGILNKPLNYINVHTPRLGGSFGGKGFTANHVGLAAAVSAYATGRPVRTSSTLSDAMRHGGKRPHILAKYKAGFTEEGKLNSIVVDVYVDNGKSESMQFVIMEMLAQLDQGYYSPNWKIHPMMLKTNKAPGTPVRGPGTTPSSVIIETILEHVAKAVQKHPILVKEINLYERNQKDLTGSTVTYCTIRQVWDRLKTSADVIRRMDQIDAFNKENRWKKRGITMAAVKYGMHMVDSGIPLNMSVFSHDGTVTVVQGGVEMGQGLFMKVAQAVAHGLGIPVEMIKVRPSLTYVTPNNSITGGSTTSEKAVNAALKACQTLQERLEPVRAGLARDADWKDLVQAAVKASVNLNVTSRPVLEKKDSGFEYFTYCAAVVETELDVLTGEYAIHRVDIMFDCGESLNPTIDIGQIEGAFVFGLGFNLQEDIIYDSNTGAVLNDGTWEYKPPTTKDIPIDWRIHLLPDAPNPVGIRSSKATGEPPTGLSVAALLALKLSAESAQQDLSGSSSFIPVQVPYTVDKIQQSIGVKLEHLKM